MIAEATLFGNHERHFRLVNRAFVHEAARGSPFDRQ